MTTLEVVRRVRVVTTLGWVGEVAVVVFVLVPSLVAASPDGRVMMLQSIFPRVVRLASVLVGVSLTAGPVLFLDSVRVGSCRRVRVRGWPGAGGRSGPRRCGGRLSLRD